MEPVPAMMMMPGSPAVPPRERDFGIVGEFVAVAGDEFFGVSFFVFRAAA